MQLAAKSSLPPLVAPDVTRQAASLNLSSINFAYPNGQVVFRALDLSAYPGEFVAVLGPSGCGKSTLLNLLSGFLQADSGSIHINGATVRPEMPELGYVFQSPNLFPWLTVLDNVRFGLKMADTLSAAEQITRARHYIDLVGLNEASDLFPHQLSGGMRQRVSLARTLAPEPSLLLADEPFGALDAITRRHMNEELLRLWTQLGQTILFITHDIDEAIFLADRVIVLGRAPQGIDSELIIDLPRPRSFASTTRLPGFLEYRNHLLDRIAYVTENHA